MMHKNFVMAEHTSTQLYLYGWSLLFIYTVFIVYASIAPFGFWAMPIRPIPYDFLYGWQNKIHLFDIYQNLLFYLPLGFLIALISQNKCVIWRLCLSILFAAALSTTLELTQSFHTTRVSSLLDVILNTISSVVGGILGCLFTLKAIAWHKIQFKIFKTDNNKYLNFTTAMLLFTWIAYHLYPYLPTLQYTYIKTGIKPLLIFWNNPEIFNIVHFIKYFVQGVLLYAAGFVLLKPRFRIIFLLLFITTILCLKIVIISRYVSIESLGGLVSAVIICAALTGFFQWRFRQSTCD